MINKLNQRALTGARENIMDIKVLFGQRKCEYPGEYAPEALRVVDQYVDDTNPDWILDQKKFIESTNEFERVEIIEVSTGTLGSECIKEKLSVIGKTIPALVI